MTITHPRTVIAVVVILAALTALAALFITPDIFPSLHTYGVSVGTSSHYCSLEFVRWHLSASCESAR